MDTTLPQHIQDFAETAASRFSRLGGPQAALRAETDDTVRDAAHVAAAEIGAQELRVRTEPDDRLAAAALCRAAGASMLPYPIVDDLLSVGGARLTLIDKSAPRIDHGDLIGRWLLADLDGNSYTAALSRRGTTKLGPFVVTADGLMPSEHVPHSDIALHLILDAWFILGALERSLTIACQHVKARTQFGKALAEFQAVRFSIADADVAVRGLEELAKFSISRWTADGSRRTWTDAVMVKLHAAQVAVHIMRTCHQLLGALGFCDESDISVIDRHLQPKIRLPVVADGLAARLIADIPTGAVETLFSQPTS
ncbi:acyl-CoA dehydrogenase [Mycobacteriaceae bacterium 1482268.1]|nr:acyl-CoA dehydrogenase [Mycobacteriaceae bacterium 1482268.1]